MSWMYCCSSQPTRASSFLSSCWSSIAGTQPSKNLATNMPALEERERERERGFSETDRKIIIGVREKIWEQREKGSKRNREREGEGERKRGRGHIT